MRGLTFLFLVVCVAYSQAATVRSVEDIRNYERFLKNSVNGQLQGNFKELNSKYYYYKYISKINTLNISAPVTPEMEELQPEWERSGKFEGDILLTEDQIDMLVDEYSGARNAITNQNRLWPNRIVVYNITRSQFSEYKKSC